MSSYSFKKLSINQVNKIKSVLSQFEANKPNNDSIDVFYAIDKIKVTLFKTRTLMIQGKGIDDFVPLKLPFLLSDNNENNVSNQKSDRDKKTKEHKTVKNVVKLKENVAQPIGNDDLSEFADIIGCDESGVGDYFGPVVYACAYIPDEVMEDKELISRIKDSKKLNDDQIEDVYLLISRKVKFLYYANSLEVFSEQIDLHKNQNVVKTISYFKLLDDFLKNYPELKSKKIVLDEYTPLNTFNKQMKYSDVENKVKFYLSTKAEDKFVSVAAASIIARYHYCQEIKKLENIYNIKLRKGASPIVKADAIKYKKMFPNDWQHFTKKHFKL